MFWPPGLEPGESRAPRFLGVSPMHARPRPSGGTSAAPWSRPTCWIRGAGSGLSRLADVAPPRHSPPGRATKGVDARIIGLGCRFSGACALHFRPASVSRNREVGGSMGWFSFTVVQLHKDTKSSRGASLGCGHFGRGAAERSGSHVQARVAPAAALSPLPTAVQRARAARAPRHGALHRGEDDPDRRYEDNEPMRAEDP
jgi:hypothetical protein